jgi:probable phosphoglycerate mutase
VLILVRHGESTANAQGLLLGRTDAALTDKGRRQAASVRQLLSAPVSGVRTSPLGRARDTAALLDLGVPIEVDDRWLEVDYGEFECQPLRDIAAACAELFAVDGAGARGDQGDVVVVSHVTPIKAAVAWALGADAGLSWRLHLQTASVTRIGWGNGAPVLHSFNEVAPDRDGTPQSPGA